MTQPWSRTRITSAFWMVESRWAMTKTVLPFIKASIPACTIRSVRVSIEEVASSKISAGGLATVARAIANNCLWPCDNPSPSPVNTVSYPCGKCLINEWALASLAAAITSSSVASKLPYLILSAIVPVNKWVSCNTTPSDFLKSAFLISLTSIPS